MENYNIEKMSIEQYVQLKKEVQVLYNTMMQMHADKRRDALYANARTAYMEKRNLLLEVLAAHPEYEKNAPT